MCNNTGRDKNVIMNGNVICEHKICKSNGRYEWVRKCVTLIAAEDESVYVNVYC